MATNNSNKARIIRALKKTRQYDSSLSIQIDNMARTMRILQKCDQTLDTLESLVIEAETSQGTIIKRHPVLDTYKEFQPILDKQMKQLGLIVDRVVEKPEAEDNIDRLTAELDKA